MTPVRAPHGAVCWSPVDGWVYDEREAQRALERNGWALMVNGDGVVYVDDAEAALLHVVLRIDADVAALVHQLGELEARSDDAVVAKLVAMTRDDDQHAQALDDLARRVDALEDRANGHDTGDAMELVAIKARLRKLEGR